MRVAAVQLEPVIADVDANLAASEGLVNEAADAGAEIVALPEFFTTGALFDPRLAKASLPFEGPATELLARLARERGIHVGGSFLCRDRDGEVRNAYALAAPDGRILGRHDKDLPTMWENALYVGGADDGVIEADGFTAGAAVCWEFMRSGTARRLRGRVDIVIGGSNWWSVPRWHPRGVFERLERSNAALARRAPAVFGSYVGAPVIHAANCGAIACAMPDMPGFRYRGHFQGKALIADASGRILAVREHDAGPGVVVAEIEPRRVAPAEPVPEGFWLHRRGPLSAWVWETQRIHGRRWYARHVRGAPAPARVAA